MRRQRLAQVFGFGLVAAMVTAGVGLGDDPCPDTKSETAYCPFATPGGDVFGSCGDAGTANCGSIFVAVDRQNNWFTASKKRYNNRYVHPAMTQKIITMYGYPVEIWVPFTSACYTKKRCVSDEATGQCVLDSTDPGSEIRAVVLTDIECSTKNPGC